MNRPAAAPVPVTATGAVAGGPAVYKGMSIKEAAGSPAAATVEVYDNASAATGTLIAVAVLSASGFYAETLTDGVRVANGIFVSVTGTVKGSIHIG